ncbi:MAG: hypothetical protein RL260_2309 [Pseudomonadota bacterium]|jgi:hypothetical protein
MLVLREGAADFFWKAQIRELHQEKIDLDIHHIFPQAWCEKQGIERKVYNSIVNKTPISYKANRMIGGTAPSIYLKNLQARKAALLALIESVMGKPALKKMDEDSDADEDLDAEEDQSVNS